MPRDGRIVYTAEVASPRAQKTTPAISKCRPQNANWQRQTRVRMTSFQVPVSSYQSERRRRHGQSAGLQVAVTSLQWRTEVSSRMARGQGGMWVERGRSWKREARCWKSEVRSTDTEGPPQMDADRPNQDSPESRVQRPEFRTANAEGQPQMNADEHRPASRQDPGPRTPGVPARGREGPVAGSWGWGRTRRG